MENPGYIALSGQIALRQQMDIVANNLANLNTPAYKSEGMLFVEYLKRTENSKTVSLVQDLALVRDFTEGPITATANPLDLAITGDGYFTVETPVGERFTRNGGFTLDAAGQVVSSEGFPLLDDAGLPITLPPGASQIDVAQDGTISSEFGPLGRIGVVRFENEQLLEKTSGSLYDAGDQDPVLVDQVEVHQGMIEESNVLGVVEITRMMDTVRRYQAMSNLVDEEHKRQKLALDHLIAAR